MKRFLRSILTLILFASLIAIPANVFALASKNPTGSDSAADGITYTNSYMGFSITLPKDWKGQYRVHNYYANPSAPYVIFTHTASEDAGVNGGELTIKRYVAEKTSKDDVIAKSPWRLALCTEDYTYFYMTPTGAEYTDATESGYRELADGVESIIQSMKAAPIALAADPAYNAVGKTDEKGLTDNYIYSFANGQKDAAPGDTLLMLNGQLTDANVIIRNNRSLIPIRTAADAFGADIQWSAATRTVTIADGNNTISMTIDQTQASVNGKAVILEAAPVIYNGRTYVPIRFVSDYLNKTVGYLPAERGGAAKDDTTVKNAARGLAYNPIIWIDDPARTSDKSTDETLIWLKSRMEKALSTLKDNADTVSYGRLKGLNTREETFDEIGKDIQNTYYIGNAGRYEMFRGPYITLVDPQANIIYFYNAAHAICGIWQADMSDPETFLGGYFFD